MAKYISYTINTSQLFLVEGVPPGTQAPQTSSEDWYRSVWFIAVMALIAIIILFVILAFCLYRSSGNRTVYVRDRDPLPPRPKTRSRPPSMSSLYTSSDRKNGSMIVSSGLCFTWGRGHRRNHSPFFCTLNSTLKRERKQKQLVTDGVAVQTTPIGC